MSIYSYRFGGSRYRGAINLTSSTITKPRRQLWICSQIHSRIVFFAIQILLILTSLAMFMHIFAAPLSGGLEWMFVFIAYALFFGAISGIWALKLTDSMHLKTRINKNTAILPKVIIIPSYIVQIGIIICFAYGTFHHLVTMWSLMKNSPLILFFRVLIPMLLAWLMILYVFAAEISYFIDLISRSRDWRPPHHQPSLLNIRASNSNNVTGRHPVESSSSGNRLLAKDALHEHERRKSSELVVTLDRNFSESRKAYNNMETRIEVMRPKHAADHMASCFAECSRKSIPIINSQLDTVPEESSKSINSLP